VYPFRKILVRPRGRGSSLNRGGSEGTGQITWWIVLTKKMRGHSGKKFAQKSRNKLLSERWGDERTRTVDAGPKCAQSWDQIQTLKECLCFHIYCAHLGTPWYSQSHLGWHSRMLFQSSKLKARSSLFTKTWQKRRSSFELWAFENVTPSGIGCTKLLDIPAQFLIGSPGTLGVV